MLVRKPLISGQDQVAFSHCMIFYRFCDIFCFFALIKAIQVDQNWVKFHSFAGTKCRSTMFSDLLIIWLFFQCRYLLFFYWHGVYLQLDTWKLLPIPATPKLIMCHLKTDCWILYCSILKYVYVKICTKCTHVSCINKIYTCKHAQNMHI